MKVLVVGSGGREHPLVWKAAQSSLVSKLYAAPGNPGMAELAELVPITDVRELAEWAGRDAIELVIVAPRPRWWRGWPTGSSAHFRGDEPSGYARPCGKLPSSP